MTYGRFQLLHRHLRLFGHTKLTDDDDFPVKSTRKSLALVSYKGCWYFYHRLNYGGQWVSLK